MRNIQSPLSGIRSPFGARRGFNPASLIRPGDVGILFEPQRMETMWQDVAGTTPVTAYGQAMRKWDDRSGGGRHATQASAASALIYGRHPVGGTRNLLTWTEDLSNAAWSAEGGFATFTYNTHADLTGAMTLDTVTYTARFGGPRQSIPLTNGVTYTVSFDAVRVSGSNALTIQTALGNATYGTFNPTGAVARYSITFTAIGSIAIIIGQDRIGGGGLGAVAMGRFQVEIGSSATPYQTVTNAYDVTESGQADCYYALCDGADNSAATPAFAWGSDKVYLCAAVRKNSDAATGLIAEFSPTIAANNGAFALQAPASAAANYSFSAKGSIASGASYTNAAVAAPNAAVIECIADIATDTSQLWIDGVMVAASGVDQGAGPFGTHQLFIGRRAGSSLPFNGLIYGLMGLNRLPSDAERATARRLMAAKQGRTL